MTDAPLLGLGAVVVGGSRGIGAAVAVLLAELGAGVVVNGRDGDTVGTIVEAITASGGSAVGLSGPASDESVAEALMSLCENEFGAVDGLVNCAPRMAAAGGGSIVNSGSFAALGDYGGTGYPAGKGAVNALTLAIAAELAEHKVRANVICPGARTRLSTGAAYESHIAALRRRGMLDELSAQAALEPAPPEYAAPL